MPFFDEGIGPVPIKEGSTPQLAQDLIETNFFKSFFFLPHLQTLMLQQQLHH